MKTLLHCILASSETVDKQNASLIPDSLYITCIFPLEHLFPVPSLLKTHVAVPWWSTFPTNVLGTRWVLLTWNSYSYVLGNFPECCFLLYFLNSICSYFMGSIISLITLRILITHFLLKYSTPLSISVLSKFCCLFFVLRVPLSVEAPLDIHLQLRKAYKETDGYLFTWVGLINNGYHCREIWPGHFIRGQNPFPPPPMSISLDLFSRAEQLLQGRLPISGLDGRPKPGCQQTSSWLGEQVLHGPAFHLTSPVLVWDINYHPELCLVAMTFPG